MKNVVSDLKQQLGQLDTTSAVDFQELQRVIGEQKNVNNDKSKVYLMLIKGTWRFEKKI